MFSLSHLVAVTSRSRFCIPLQRTRPNRLVASIRQLSTQPSQHAIRPHRCHSCGQPLPSAIPACMRCWNIAGLAPNTSSHDVFDLPSEPNPFIVDVPLLKRRFRQAQSICHPDSWASKGSKKQDLAQALSSQVNEAYQSLLHPLSRVEYLLHRQGLSMEESDQAQDLEFMMDVMQARESIEDAENSSEIEVLFEETADKIQKTIKEIEILVGEGNWNDVKAAAIRLKYLYGIERAARTWLEERPQ